MWQLASLAARNKISFFSAKNDLCLIHVLVHFVIHDMLPRSLSLGHSDAVRGDSQLPLWIDFVAHRGDALIEILPERLQGRISL